MLATRSGFAFCKLANRRPVSSREFAFEPAPLELDVDEPEDDGPREILGLGTFGMTVGGVPAVVGYGTNS